MVFCAAGRVLSVLGVAHKQLPVKVPCVVVFKLPSSTPVTVHYRCKWLSWYPL